MDKDKNNRNRKKKEESEDILGMIRKRQEQNDTNYSSGSKIREFLENLPPNTCDEDYSDTPIYKLGYEDGFDEAEEMFSQKMRDVRRTIKNLLTHL